MLQRKCVALSTKAMGEDGSFEGYGSVFGTIDSYGERVAKGAFQRTIEERGPNGVALLWQHNMAEPIGVWTEMREDDNGLYMKGSLVLDTQRGREAYALLKAGALNGLSIGFVARQRMSEGDVVTLTDVDLWETSLVTFPANPDARVTSVREALAEGIIPNPSDVERAVRSALNLSRSQAKAFMARGYEGLTQAPRDADGHIVAKLAALTELLRRAS